MTDSVKHGGRRPGSGRKADPKNANKQMRIPLGVVEAVKDIIKKYKGADNDSQRGN